MRTGGRVLLVGGLAVLVIFAGVDAFLLLESRAGASATDFPFFDSKTLCDHRVMAGQADRWTVAVREGAGAPRLTASGLPPYGAFADNGDGTGTAAFHPPTDTASADITISITASSGTGAATLNCTERVIAAPDSPPSVVLALTRSSGVVPVTVTADASASTDMDGTPIASYRFDFGDGTVVGPQPGPTASHTYASAGRYTVTVVVTDTAGLSSRATASASVSPPPTPIPTARSTPPPATAFVLSPATGTAPLTIRVDASDSKDAAGNPLASYRFDFGDGTIVGPQSSPSASHTYTRAGTYTVRVTGTDSGGRTGVAVASVQVSPAP